MAEKHHQGSRSSSDSGALAALILFAIGCAGLWIGARWIVVKFLFAPAWFEMHLIRLTIGLGEKGNQFLEYVTATFDGRVNPDTVYWSDIVTVLTAVGNFIRWPVSIIIIAMTVLIMLKMKGDGFSRTFSLNDRKKGSNSFIRYQSSLWKTIKPALVFNPDNLGTNEDPARTPLEWLRDNDISPQQKERGGDITLPMEETADAFTRQLGDPWTGLREAPVHVQFLAVLAALNYSWSKSRRKLGEDAASIMSQRAPEEKIRKDLAALIAPHLANRLLVNAVEKVASRHHYQSTVICALYEWSRRKGAVLASAEVRWLKRVDRVLWYAINNLGRRAFHVEAAGVIAHYFSECVNGEKIDKPFVLPAIQGLQSTVSAMGISNLDAYFRETDDFKIAEQAILEADMENRVFAEAASRKKRSFWRRK